MRRKDYLLELKRLGFSKEEINEVVRDERELKGMGLSEKDLSKERGMKIYELKVGAELNKLKESDVKVCKLVMVRMMESFLNILPITEQLSVMRFLSDRFYSRLSGDNPDNVEMMDAQDILKERGDDVLSRL